MIAVRCPFCHVGLKVDETRLPADITTFPCPKCKKLIPVTVLASRENAPEAEPETSVIRAAKASSGQLTVVSDAETNTPAQVYPLPEGTSLIGRRSDSSRAAIAITTSDRSMSREHACIEVKKNAKGGYKHSLSDNNSKNRTLYNRRYLENGEIVVLQDNDEIVLGRTVLRFNE